jgi:hypothetical protein
MLMVCFAKLAPEPIERESGRFEPGGCRLRSALVSVAISCRRYLKMMGEVANHFVEPVADPPPKLR